ncbi:phage tail protein [Leuconostoc mesenteroides]|uniref:phage tail protein n=1 Tax=Leuconostoc mesenteroides TaxID=1245 RepID=UPI0007756642|nr:phage tail protein [Leuconostoc mesenteroides]
MITFKNIAGNKFLAVGTIQRKSALNGEKSLTGTLYDGDDVLNKIDKGWSLEFDNEPYIVTYFERNDNDNSVSFDAIHKFFWDMAKNVLYSETSGSHTIKWYLDQIFANTGYSYALNFNPNAIAKDNWGMKNKLSLFNDVITSIEGEFEINGTLVSIFKNIGTDLSTIVRYGFNLSDMTIENDASGFVTYGEGFGAYADQENMTGDRLHVTYTSPLASVYGKLQAEPIDDQRYTIESNLLDAVKSQVDASFSISVNLSLYDLSVAGYPYKMANVGDWLTAVDENLDFKQRIRIISIDDAFAADGTRISYSVTAGDIGLTKKYQDANASIANKVEDAVISAGQAATDANIALIAANGKNKSYHLNDINDLPKTANEGDLAWVQSGDGRVLYIYTKKADGTYYWEKRIDPEMGKQIEAGVTDAVSQANAHTDEVKQSLSSDINTAKSQAVSQASTAEANAKSEATSLFNRAQNALSDAKTDLTKSIASEASERSQTVAAVNSQAQTYANQAKADALNAVTKEVTDRQNAVTALDTKATNAVNQAKSDITDTINAISVGGRNLLLGTGNWAGDSTRWSKRGTVTDNSGTYRGVIVASSAGAWTSPVYMMQNAGILQVGKTYTFSTYVRNTSDTDTKVAPYYDNGIVTPMGTTTPLTAHTDWFRVSITFKVIKDPTTSTSGLRWEGTYGLTNGFIQFAGYKLEEGNLPTYWTPAPEDVVLDYTTKDEQIKATITQYQTTNDGKVSKAQTDATTALGQVATKVSQTDYDTKTGDLTTKYTQVKQTADSQAADIVDIKEKATSQASKINSISSDVDGTKQSISDIETTQDSQSNKINQITTDVNGTKQSITDIQTQDGKQDTRMGTIETSVSGVKSDFGSYKTTNDGAVKTAQTTAQAAVDGLKFKVSQTDYNTKTGQLQTDLTSTTQTANQAKTDIVSIKQTDTSQDARMTQIESDATGVKTTVSNLQTTQGKQSGDISTLQQRADGFDATVTKISTSVNSLNQINNVINSEFSPDLAGWYVRGDTGHASVIDSGSFGYNTSGYAVIDSTGKTGSDLYLTSAPYPVNAGGVPFSETLRIRANVSNATVGIGVVYYDVNKSIIGAYRTTVSVTGNWGLFSYSGTLPSTAYYISFDVMIPSSTLARFVISQPMIVTSTTIGDYVAGSYNNNDALAKVKLTADNAALNLSKYQTDADGRISKAQADIVTNANSITQKVSQTDYDKKTGDLTTAVSKAQTTADGVVTTVGNYQTSNDKRVKAAESAISQNADAIALKVAKTDYDSNNSQLNTRFTKVETTANGTATTVSDLKQTVNSMGQVNQLFNTEFSPDFQGWFIRGAYGQDISKVGWVKGYPVNGHGSISHVKQPYAGNLQSPLVNATGAGQISISAVVSVYSDDGVGNSYITLDAFSQDGTFVSQIAAIFIQNGASDKYIKLENITIPSDVSYISLGMLTPSATVTYKLSQPMLVFASTVGTYVQGNYNNNAALAQVKITADGISNFVRDPSGNISSDFQTALSKTSIITGSTLATSIQKQTATQITSALTDNNGKIISLINQDSSGVQIAGKNLAITADTTVDGNFWAKQVNAVQVSASNITVGTLNGNQVDITNVNAANITGDITNFIQSNWNGVYGSTAITSSGMTVTSPGTVALFNVNGMTLDGAGGMTRVANGFTQIYSATHENIGMIGHQKDVDHDNVDYITFGLNGYRTTNDGDSHWVGGSDFYGGDGMGFGVSNRKGTYDLKLRWDSDLIAGYKGELQGWHASDQFIFDNKTFHKGYADFSGGVTMSGAYSEGTRSLHTQGMSISTGAKWFGFMDGSNSTGFGTDQTQDVLFYVKGQVYSLYTMLGKLGMR